MKTYDILEAAAFLKVDRTTVLGLAGRGELPGAKIGRAWVFLEDELVEYLRTQTHEQTRTRIAQANVDDELQRTIVRGSPRFLPPPVRGRRKQSLPALPEFAG